MEAERCSWLLIAESLRATQNHHMQTISVEELENELVADDEI